MAPLKLNNHLFWRMTILCRLELNSALLSNSIFSYECASIFMWMLKTASLNLRHTTSSVSMKKRCQLWQTICIYTTHLQGKAYRECEGIKVERHETHSHNHKPLWAEDLVLLTHKTSTLNLIFATLLSFFLPEIPERRILLVIPSVTLVTDQC